MTSSVQSSEAIVASELSESFNKLKTVDVSTSCLTLSDTEKVDREGGKDIVDGISSSNCVERSISVDDDCASNHSMESVDINDPITNDSETTIVNDLDLIGLEDDCRNLQNDSIDVSNSENCNNNSNELHAPVLSGTRHLSRSHSIPANGNPFTVRPAGLQFSSIPKVDILSPSSSEEVPICDSEPIKVFRHQSVDSSCPPANSIYHRHVGCNINRKLSTTFDDLLHEIYDRWHYGARHSFDSDTFTDLTESDAFQGRSDVHHLEKDHQTRLNEGALLNKSIVELRKMRTELLQRSSQMSASLVKQLKRRNRQLAMNHNNCDVITAVIQASSLKRSVDSKIKFSIEPLPGDDAFNQWKDAMKAVARLPSGIPPEFRRKVWLALADNYLTSLHIDWEKTRKFAFNEKSNPDDNKLGLQIVKDLHRTGCSGFSGSDNEQDRAVLKRVLLAYARWNKLVGYCQGFNVLAALILDVMDRKEDNALKVMIFLIDKVLPEGYFANNLRALSVDMAVFRDLLQAQHPALSQHLIQLQTAARDCSTGANYEPPLTNVFTMQWFLTLFATCVSKTTALRIWDSVLLEGSEILLRTAIAIWGTMQEPILLIQSADEFYTSMGALSQDVMDGKVVDTDQLIKTVYNMASFPFPHLAELREKYTYNITPFSPVSMNGNGTVGVGKRRSANQSSLLKPRASGGRGVAGSGSVGAGSGAVLSDDDMEDDDMIDNIHCFTGFFPPSPTNNKRDSDKDDSSADISKLSPGAYAAHPEIPIPTHTAHAERITLDIAMLHQQYKRLRHRQKQAHIIFAAVSARSHRSTTHPGGATSHSPMVVAPIESPVAVNHLFLGREMLDSGASRNRKVVLGPTIASKYYDSRSNTRSTVHSLTKSSHSGDHSPGVGRNEDKISLNVDTGGGLKNENLQRSRDNSCSLSVVSDESTVSLGSNFDTNSESSLEITSTDRRDPTLLDEDESMVGEEKSGGEDMVISGGDNIKLCSEGVDVRGSIETQPQDELTSHCFNRNESINLSHSTPSSSKTFSASSSAKLKLKLEPEGLEQELKDCTSDNSTFNSGIPGTQSKSPKSPSDRRSSCSSRDKPSIQPASSFKLVVESWCAARDARKASISSPGQNRAELEDDNDASPQRAFNPFPKQHSNPRRTKHGVQLGMYSTENVSKIESLAKRSGLGARPPRPATDRAKRDAYIHRQYLAEISSGRDGNY